MNQTHECAPALSEAEYFATRPAHERPIFEAVRAFVETLGPVHVEFVSVGIFLKRGRTFAELRPRERWVALSFSLRRSVRHRLIVRKVLPYHGRYFHVANLRRPDDFDDALQDWLAEAYLDAEPES